VLVCVSHGSHPEPVCEEISLPGESVIVVGSASFQIVLGFTGGVNCTGAHACASGSCEQGPATAWWVRMVPISPYSDWWQVDFDLPAPVCACPMTPSHACEPPGCEMLFGCGDDTYSVRMYDDDLYYVHFYMLGLPAVPNLNTTLPLHAVITEFGPCDIPDPCEPGPPTVNVPAGSQIAAYLVMRNHQHVPGVQTAFDWGDWTFLHGAWDCQAGQVVGTTPAPPGGPIAGTIATVFDCVTGGSTEVIGRIHFIASTTDCLTQVESGFTFGTHVLDSSGNTAPVLPENRGTICVGAGGFDACGPTATAVDAASWGAIKASYR
jgi:hypothetical protein